MGASVAIGETRPCPRGRAFLLDVPVAGGSGTGGTFDWQTVPGQGPLRHRRLHRRLHRRAGDDGVGAAAVAALIPPRLPRRGSRPFSRRRDRPRRGGPEYRPSCPNVRFSVDGFRLTPGSEPGAEGPSPSPPDPTRRLASQIIRCVQCGYGRCQESRAWSRTCGMVLLRKLSQTNAFRKCLHVRRVPEG